MKETEKSSINLLLEKYKIDFSDLTNKQKLKILKNILFTVKVDLDYNELLLQENKISTEEFIEKRIEILKNIYNVNSAIEEIRSDIRIEHKNRKIKGIKKLIYVKK